MQYRVAFVGPSAWLKSARLTEVRQSRHVITAYRSTPESLSLDNLLDGVDIALLHFRAHDDRALDVVESARRSGDAPRFVAVTRSESEALMRRVIACGVWGWIREFCTAADHHAAITRVGAGRLAYPPDMLDRIDTDRGRMTLLPRREALLDVLTLDELAILRLLGDGFSMRQAAHVLGATLSTAQKYRARLMAIFEVDDEVSLVRLARRTRIIPR